MISLLVHIIIYVVIIYLFHCIEQFTTNEKYLINQKV